MKTHHTVLTFGILLLAVPAFGQSMANMPGMARANRTTAVKTGQGMGIVTAIDAKAGTITIKHGPIPAVGWPAMTMTFRATPATLLSKAKVGRTVAFAVRTRGMDAEVTSLRSW